MSERTWPRTASSQRIEPVAAGEWRWRCRHGWRSFLHGVGSFSIVPIATYAASANFHQPRDTTNLRHTTPHRYAHTALNESSIRVMGRWRQVGDRRCWKGSSGWLSGGG
jgi:hypothetical protein